MQKSVGKVLLAAFLVLAISKPIASQADSGKSHGNEFRGLTTYFYRHSNPELVPKIIEYLSSEAIKTRDRQPPLIGLLSSIFRQYPGRVQTWVELAAGRTAKGIVAQALWYADRQQDARNVLQSSGFSPKSVAWLEKQPASPLRFKISNADHLDILWGAFFGSGDIRYVQKIIGAVENANNNQHIVMEDVIFSARHVGRKHPRGRKIGEKYKSLGSAVIRDYIMGVTALWALGSNSKQHEIVGQFIEAEYIKNPDDSVAIALKRLAFGNAHPKLVKIGNLGNVGVISAVTPTPRDAEIIADPKRRGETTNVTNTLKRGSEYFSIQFFHIPAETILHYKNSLHGPGATTLIVGQSPIAAAPTNRLMRFINKIDAAHIKNPGKYRITITTEIERGQRTELTSDLLVY
jgi:hypothetical protein